MIKNKSNTNKLKWKRSFIMKFIANLFLMIIDAVSGNTDQDEGDSDELPISVSDWYDTLEYQCSKYLNFPQKIEEYITKEGDFTAEFELPNGTVEILYYPQLIR